MQVLLVHSPLVGPATLEPLAAELRVCLPDATVRVPDLRDALTSARPQWRAIVDAAVVAIGGPGGAPGTSHADVLVGHSGAGAFLPVLAERLGAGASVYVDAVVPGDGDTHVASAMFRQMLDRLPREADDPFLPPWDEWWGPDTIARLVPEPSMRARITAEIRRVPASFYDDPVPLPSGWAARPCSYLQLSAAYDEDRARAEALGWPTDRLVGRHLDTAVRPTEVARRVAALVGTVAHHG